MGKPVLVVSGPITTRSGYGDHARDLIHSLIRMDRYEIRIISTRWGSTPMDALCDTDDKDKLLLDRIVSGTITEQPDIFIQITVPNEFQRMGKFNIGITAGIESTVTPINWIEGCNQMDLVIVPSEHSKNVFTGTHYSKVDSDTKQHVGEIVIRKPIEVLFEGVDVEVFGKKHKPSVSLSRSNSKAFEKLFDTIEEDFNFLFVGHWLSGDLGQDRKNLGFLIQTFLTLFENVPNAPGLILKTSSFGFSVIDREAILDKIRSIKSKFGEGTKLPNIYVVHGDLTQEQLSNLYRDKKVKCHVSFTKGEGFGRPLLEASLSGKPIIASKWSGHLDFLDEELCVLLGGELNPIHPSAANDMLLKAAHWFNVSLSEAARGMLDVFANYEKYEENARKLASQNRKNFSLDKMDEDFDALMKKYATPPEEVKIKLPELKLPALND